MAGRVGDPIEGESRQMAADVAGTWTFVNGRALMTSTTASRRPPAALFPANYRVGLGLLLLWLLLLLLWLLLLVLLLLSWIRWLFGNDIDPF